MATRFAWLGECGKIKFYYTSRLPDVAMEYKTWMCLVCGFIYQEERGLPDEGIPAGTRWQDVPPNWSCPECGARKEDFEMIQV